MHSIILYLIKKSLPKSYLKGKRAKKLLPQPDIEEIFSQNDEHPHFLMPSFQFTFNLQSFLADGIDLQLTKKPLSSVAVIGPEGVGKSELIASLLGHPLSLQNRRPNQVLCYQTERECFLEHRVDQDDEASLFLRDVLIEACSQAIIITEDLAKEPVVPHAIYIVRTRSHCAKAKIISKMKLTKGLYSYTSNQNHYIFHDEQGANKPELRLLVRQLTTPFRPSLVKALQLVVSRATQLLPYRFRIEDDGTKLTLATPLTNLRLLDQYLIDYYQGRDKAVAFEMLENHAILRSAAPYMKLKLLSAEVSRQKELVLKCELLDARFQLVIPFAYRRKTNKDKVSIQFTEENVTLLSFV